MASESNGGFQTPIMIAGLQAKLTVLQNKEWKVQDGIRFIAIQARNHHLRLAILSESGFEQFGIDLMDNHARNSYDILEGFPKLIINSDIGLKTMELTILSEQIPQQTPQQIFVRFSNMVHFLGCFCSCKLNAITPMNCSPYLEPSNLLVSAADMAEVSDPDDHLLIVKDDLVDSYLQRLRCDIKFQNYCKEIESIWLNNSSL